jgi:hypothetical protein
VRRTDGALFVATIALLALLTGASWGADETTLFGSTGLILTPTADVLTAAELSVHYHQVNNAGNLFGRRFSPRWGDTSVFGANVGLTDWLETGITRFDADNVSSQTIFHTKARLELSKMTGLKSAPDVGIGVWDWTGEVNRAYFVVLSRRLTLTEDLVSTVINGHLGYGDNEDDQGALDGIFGGIDFTVGHAALVQVEYDAQDFNALVRYKVGHRLTADAGALDGKFTFGVSYNTEADYKRDGSEWGGFGQY